MSELKRISPQQASDALAQGYTYVDVRTPEEFGAGHAPGAVNVPVMFAAGPGMAMNPDFIPAMDAAFAKDARIVVGCKAGRRSLRAAQMLLQAGFTDVLDNRAGWDGERDPFGKVTEPGWSRLDLPVEQGQPSGRAWEDLRKKI